MFGTIAISVLAGIAFLVAWYLLFLRYNRRQAVQALRRLRTAFAGEAQIIGVHWLTPSQLSVNLRVMGTMFQSVTLRLQLLPRQLPFQWAWSRLAKRQETMTFEADLECPPSFNLDVQNQRWCGRTRKMPRNLQRLAVNHCGPFVVTTRNDWQRDITGMLGALVASRDYDFLSVTYRKTSPHLSVTMPLESIAAESECDAQLFEVLRELASCGEASRF